MTFLQCICYVNQLNSQTKKVKKLLHFLIAISGVQLTCALHWLTKTPFSVLSISISPVSRVPKWPRSTPDNHRGLRTHAVTLFLRQTLLHLSPSVSVYRAERTRLSRSQSLRKLMKSCYIYTHAPSLFHIHIPQCTALSLSLSLCRTLCSLAHAAVMTTGAPFSERSPPPPPALTSSVSKSQGVCLSWRLSICLRRRVTASKTGALYGEGSARV